MPRAISALRPRPPRRSNKLAPSNYTITAIDPVITSATVDSTGFTFAGAETGTTYVYTIASSGGGSLSSSGSVISATQSVTGLNLSSLNDGTITYNVTLTDPVGQESTAATASATLIVRRLVGYSISASPAVVNAAGIDSAGFIFAGATANTNTTYQFTVTSSNGGVPVTGGGPVTSPNETISGIHLTGLHDGTLTYSVSLTENGHTGAAVVSTATLDTTAPSGFTPTPDQSTINGVAVNSTGFRLTGAETGTTYSYTISGLSEAPAIGVGEASVSGSGSVTSATQDITGIDLSPGRRHGHVQRDADRHAGNHQHSAHGHGHDGP